MAAPLVTVTIKETGLEHLADVQTMAQAEAEIIETGVDILEPLARSEAPHKTGRGARFIRGFVERQGNGHLIGRIAPIGRGFYLRILATGFKAHEIAPTRFVSRRGRARNPARIRMGLKDRAGRAVSLAARGGFRALRIPGIGFRRRAMIPARGPDPFLERAARTGAPRVTAAADQIIVRHLGGRAA